MLYINDIKEKKVNILKKCIITADFETLLVNNEHYVFAIGFKDDLNYKNLFIDNTYIEDKEIINASFNLVKEFLDILSISYKKPYVYFHNLGSFDGIFILKCIDNNIKNINDFNCIIRNNTIYKIQYKNITFLDSILLINDKLDKIAKDILNTKKILIIIIYLVHINYVLKIKV
jgi:hypothetical protein